MKKAVLLIILLFALPAFAQKKDYQPNQKIEYQDASGKWIEGTFVEATPDGSQPIILQKPNEFYPQGSRTATSWDKIREPVTKAPVPPKSKPAAGPIAASTGLMTQAEVLAFLQAKLGDEPFSNPERESVYKELAEIIKKRGLNFHYDPISDFSNQIGKFGVTSVVTFPLTDNYGPPTKQPWLMGKWSLGKITRNATYEKNEKKYDGGESVVKNIGSLTINAGRRYTWKSTTAKSTTGKWRPATPEEMRSQGGAGLVLLKAKSGYDWLITQDRVTPLKGKWIKISELKSRQINEYGSA